MKTTLKQKVYNKLPEKNRDKIVTVYHVFRTVKNVVCWLLIIALVLTVILSMVTRFSGKTPSVFGYTLQRVSSGSMVPALQVGDVILSKKTDDPSTLKKGDIITFRGGSEFSNNHVTHRVITAPYTNESGVLVLQTQGDANNASDPPIKASSVESIYITTLGWLTKMYEIFLSPWGLLIFIGLLLFVFFDELLNIVRIVTGNYKDEDEEDINDIIARIQREDREKALAEKKSEDGDGE